MINVHNLVKATVLPSLVRLSHQKPTANTGLTLSPTTAAAYVPFASRAILLPATAFLLNRLTVILQPLPVQTVQVLKPSTPDGNAFLDIINPAAFVPLTVLCLIAQMPFLQNPQTVLISPPLVLIVPVQKPFTPVGVAIVATIYPAMLASKFRKMVIFCSQI